MAIDRSPTQLRPGPAPGATSGPSIPAPRLSRGARAAVVLLVVDLSFSGIFSHSLWSLDEPSGAAVGRNMLDHGDLAVPEIGGWRFLEKPPLY